MLTQITRVCAERSPVTWEQDTRNKVAVTPSNWWEI